MKSTYTCKKRNIFQELLNEKVDVRSSGVMIPSMAARSSATFLGKRGHTQMPETLPVRVIG